MPERWNYFHSAAAVSKKKASTRSARAANTELDGVQAALFRGLVEVVVDHEQIAAVKRETRRLVTLALSQWLELTDDMIASSHMAVCLLAGARIPALRVELGRPKPKRPEHAFGGMVAFVSAGCRISELLDEVRHHEALRLMRKGELAVGEAAERLGLDDASAFARLFRPWAGSGPSSVKRRRAQTPPKTGNARVLQRKTPSDPRGIVYISRYGDHRPRTSRRQNRRHL